MLQSRNILCISNPLWDGNYAKSTVEIMKVLVRSNKILFVDNAYTLKDLFDHISGKKKILLARALGLKDRIRAIQLEDKNVVYVLTPPITLTINFLSRGFIYNSLLNFNGWLVRRTIKKGLSRLNMKNDLIVIAAFNPAMGLVNAGKLKEKLLLYYCYDQIEASPWLKKHGGWLEKEFAKKVDGIIVSSRELYESKKELAAPCFIVKNGVNINLFKQGFRTDIDTEKVIGYVGSIDDRLDYDLLEELFSAMPDTHFVFVGRVVSERGGQLLKKYSNVDLKGAKPVEELPGYLKTFSLGIIPFIKDDFTKGIYPMKINEYLAAGLPVVSTDFSLNINDFHAIIKIASNSNSFLSYVREELQNDSAAKREKRVEVANSNTWESRAEDLSKIISTLENSKAS